VLKTIAANALVGIGLLLQGIAALIHILGDWIERFGNGLTEWD
jgi:hypothetical protein